MRWEVVLDDPLKRVRRVRVPGGWLYQVEFETRSEDVVYGSTPGWHPPVFVPGGES